MTNHSTPLFLHGLPLTLLRCDSLPAYPRVSPSFYSHPPSPSPFLSSVALLSSVREYVAISDALPGMAAEVVQRLCDLLRLFNSRTCQLVLGAGAMQVGT